MRALLLLLLFLLPSVACATPERVAFTGHSPGTIVVKTNERRLYLVTGNDEALRYVVGVGRSGLQWSGTASIDGKYIKPAWQAPSEMIARNPRLTRKVIAGGSSQNPMGAAALTLTGDKYAIHGTNNSKSIGGFVSNGCIRMYNEDILDLFSRVRVGTQVVVK